MVKAAAANSMAAASAPLAGMAIIMRIPPVWIYRWPDLSLTGFIAGQAGGRSESRIEPPAPAPCAAPWKAGRRVGWKAGSGSSAAGFAAGVSAMTFLPGLWFVLTIVYQTKLS
ncbi:hypothetical protein VY88_27685 [Azospirillum thiophilum]|nr:hypothetical protein VY88_24570 [Azospirillum thiophilum]KJR62658.1 hypothetical protein VY88_27685 [Azospirillum thiophilum]